MARRLTKRTLELAGDGWVEWEERKGHVRVVVLQLDERDPLVDRRAGRQLREEELVQQHAPHRLGALHHRHCRRTAATAKTGVFRASDIGLAHRGAVVHHEHVVRQKAARLVRRLRQAARQITRQLTPRAALALPPLARLGHRWHDDLFGLRTLRALYALLTLVALVAHRLLDY